MTESAFLTLQNVNKKYASKSGDVAALSSIELSVAKGEFVTIQGASGSGKTTLLLTLGGMLRPTAGSVMIDGTDLYGLSPRRRATFRSHTIGFVFQMFHLVPYLSALENVLLGGHPERNGGNPVSTRERAQTLLDDLGIGRRRHHRPSELSAGEKQRAAIARALINTPKLILADEPTGNLDPNNASEVVHYLQSFHRGGGTVIMVTHGNAANGAATRIIHLDEGRITSDTSETSSGGACP